MPKVKLDSTFVLIASCPKGKSKVDFYCRSITGFILEVRPNGSKTYAVRYRDEHGRQRQYKIGNAADLSFAKAKAEAIKVRSRVTVGENPAADKQVKRSIPAYSELADRYTAHVRTYQRDPQSAERALRNHILPRWGKLRLTDILQSDVAAWLAEKSNTLAPATVERMRVVFQHTFKMAKVWGFPGADVNPVAGIPRPTLNNAVDRRLTAEEAQRLKQAVAKSRNKQLKYLVGLLILSGCRVSELLHAKWKDVDIEGRSWRVPVAKSGRARHIPLSQAAIDLLNEVPRFTGCPYVVPNPNTLRPFVDIFRTWDVARKQAGVPDLRIHDLRHAAASFMINAGVDIFTVGKVLGHNSVKTTSRYAHVANSTLLAAVDAGASGLGMSWADKTST